MPTTTNKQRLVTQVFTAIGKGRHYPDPPARPVLEQFLYAICREGVTRDAADKAFRSLKDQFFDWNEVRVSSSRELAVALDSLPEAEQRGQRMIDFLQEVFETTFSFDLDSLDKKGMRQAAKQLARYQAANDYAVAWVVQQSLGGHSMPLDAPSLRVLRRLGLIEEDEDNVETLRASIEHHVPKAKANLFGDLISAVAEDHCHDDEPRCSSCPLLGGCPTGQEAKSAVAAHAPHRHKPRYG